MIVKDSVRVNVTVVIRDPLKGTVGCLLRVGFCNALGRGPGFGCRVRELGV